MNLLVIITLAVFTHILQTLYQSSTAQFYACLFWRCPKPNMTYC